MYRERKNRIIQLNVKRKSFLLLRVIDGFDGRGQRLYIAPIEKSAKLREY